MINRTEQLLAEVRVWADEFSHIVTGGIRSARIQWNIDGHAEPLTLYANKTGTYIVEPGSKPVSAVEWLGKDAA